MARSPPRAPAGFSFGGLLAEAAAQNGRYQIANRIRRGDSMFPGSASAAASGIPVVAPAHPHSVDQYPPDGHNALLKDRLIRSCDRSGSDPDATGFYE